MITIPCRLYSSKNSRTIKKFGDKTILGKSDKAYQNSKDLHILLLDAGRKWQWADMIKDKDWPLMLRLKYYPPDNIKYDHINIYQNLLDAMQDAGWLPDDNYMYVCPVFDPEVIVDKINPRVELNVL